LRTILIFIVLACLLASGAAAQEPAVLQDLAKEEGVGVTRLLFDFSGLPEHRLESSGQRVDLFLIDTETGSLPSLPEDGKVVKILLIRRGKELMISFLLRTVPASVKVLTEPRDSRLILDLTWGSEADGSRSAPAAKARKLANMQSGELLLKLLRGEDFASQWQRFCAQYETSLQVPATIHYALPPLPLLVFNPMTGGPVGAQLLQGVEALRAGRWPEALEVFGALPAEELQGVDREAFPLLYGETLLRVGQGTSGRQVLENFLRKYPDSPLRVRALYLLGYLQAAMGQPYDSVFQLANLREAAGDAGYYRQLGLLLRAEVELATGRHAEALATLAAETWPAPLATHGQRLRADALFDAGRYGEARQAYAALAPAIKAWGVFPQSLARLAEALYRKGEYAAAARRYAELVQVAANTAEQGLATFGHARALIRAGSTDEGLSLLRTVAKDHAHDEGGQRAHLLLYDEEVLAAPAEKGFMHIQDYQRMGVDGATRELREEAAFKHVLLALAHSPDVTSLGFLEEFIRQHRNGRFYELAEALLNEVLPTMIREQMRREDYFGALSLVEKYRHLLLVSGVRPELLIELGKALQTMGLLDKAANVYLYMLEAYRNRPEEERFYQPLLDILIAKGEHQRIVEYADRYLERFAKGDQRQAMSRLKLKALVAQEDYPGAAKILTSGVLKRDPELDLLAGTVFWEVNDPERVVEALERALADTGARRLHPQALLLLAETHFKQGRGALALPLYGELGAVPSLADQAQYRRAQILLQTGRKQEALKLFRELAEKGTNPRWRQAAEGAVFAEKTL